MALQSRTPGDTSNAATWLLQDRLGSTVAQSTTNGRVTDLVSYSDFGIPSFTSTGYASATGFTGELTDATTGTNSYFSRTYDPFTATWLTADTYRGTLTNPQSQHRYGYVEGNPATNSDYMGFAVLDDYAYGQRNAGPAQTKSRATTQQQNAKPCFRNSCVNTPSHHNDTSNRHPPICIGRGCQAGPGAPLFTPEQLRANRANDQVSLMLTNWVSGSGPREYGFGPNDAFTQRFLEGESAAIVTSQIREGLMNAQPNASYDGTFSLYKGGRQLWIFRDAMNLASWTGNLPETFIGSFEYRFTVTSLTSTAATVTVTAKNTTSIESATRIPSTGLYVPGTYGYMHMMEDIMGAYAPTTQTITWTQEIER